MYRIFMMRRWILLVVLVQFAYGYQETYRISQLSPKSVADERFHTNVLLQTSHVENVAFSLDPSNKYDDIEFNPKDIISEKETENHVMVERSAQPSRDSRSINIEEIPSSNNNEIDNEIVLHNKRKYYEIVPTKTLDYTINDDDESVFMSTGFGDKLDFKFPGEGKRAPKGRALAPTGPKIRPTAVQPPTFATNTLKDQARQNTEIQNIITGIVKLLNGNVNVQANTQLLNGRPRPMASRINNRGPPRITDVPLLPDYDKPMTPPPPVFHSTKTPPPYPFDRPPVINLPDQMVPPKTTRPGFHRPMLPWQRPRPRPIPSRRPNPGLPVYKPTLIPPPEFPEDEKQEETIVNENETNYENNIHHDDIIPFITLPESTTELKNTTEEIEKEVQVTTETTTTTTTESTTSTTTTTTQKPETTTEKQTEPTTQKTTEKPKTEKPMKPDKDKKKETNTEKDKSRDKYKVDAVEKPKTEYPIIEIESSIADVSSTKAPVAPTPTVELSRHTPVIAETTAIDVITSSINTHPISTIPYEPYRPRPGIVLDDTDFKPHATRHRTDASIITAAETRLPGYGEIFDVTVSAIQGPGEKGASIHIENVNIHNEPDIIVTPSGSEGFVSIDGQRTYMNLFDTTSQRASIAPTRLHNPPYHTAAPQPTVGAAIGTGVAIPADDVPLIPPRPQKRPPNRPPYRRPQTTVRIDTCIVGDDSTCDHAQNEKCRTEAGISSCQCRPGYARRTHRDPCRGVVSLVLNLRVDRIDDKKVAWDEKLSDKESDSYHQMSFEAVRAIHSAFSMTPYSDEFVSSSVNSIHQGDDRKVYVNYTILMEENLETTRPAIATEIQKHIMGVIRRRSNNVGISALWVDTPAGSVLPLIDLDECSSPELNDCHALASCNNTWGAFKCTCADTTLDSATLPHLSGRNCRVCPDSQCSGRGFCRYTQGRPHCNCYSGYYGSTCEIDGDVIGVSVGVSLAAILVIGVTLTLLMLWSRKWSREQKAAGMGSPVFNYMAANTVKTPPVGQPPYQVTLEERMRWSQLAEAMAQASHYASADLTQTMATRPSSAMFGYPTLPPVPLPRMHGVHTGTLNTVTSRANTAASYNIYGYTNHMAESASSEASSHVQDRADLLVPRPKSRARSMHNQTGIYYDVDYENTEPIYGTKGIPLSTYTVSRGPPFYR